MKKVMVYEVQGHNDTCEGRGGTHLVGFFGTRDLADNAAKDKGVWGAPGYVEECFGYLLEIDNEFKFVREKDLHKIMTETHEETVARAKVKLASALTAEELKALGLK